MEDTVSDGSESVDVRKTLARVLCRFDFPEDSTADQRREIWASNRQDYMKKARRLLKMLERDGMALSKVS